MSWATTMAGPTREDEIDGVAAAADGSVWITGKFERSTTLGGEELTSAGAADIPLARFDPAGPVRWVRSFGGKGEDNLFDIDAGPGGAVGTGWFEGTVAFDDVELTSEGGSDCVVVSFDDDGEVRWATSFGGPGADGCNEVVVSDDGTVTASLDTARLGLARRRARDRRRSDVVLDAARRRQRAAVGRSGLGGRAPSGRASRSRWRTTAPVALEATRPGTWPSATSKAAAPGGATGAWVVVWPTASRRRSRPGAATATTSPRVWRSAPTASGRSASSRAPWRSATRPSTPATRRTWRSCGWRSTARRRWRARSRPRLPLAGAEVTTAADGGVLFGTPNQPGTALVTAEGSRRPLASDAAAALLWWSPDGSVRGWTVPGTRPWARTRSTGSTTACTWTS
ncbi:MAG: hypothetical protein R2711_18485 [Acidimicrobiales bacterium]